MTQQTTRQVGTLALVVLSCSVNVVLAADSGPTLTPSDHAAIRAYYAELQKTAGSNTIIDLGDPALHDRIQRSSHRQMKSPEIPAELRRQHAHGRVILGAVTEMDGTVTNAKVVVSSGYASFDEEARRALAAARYDQPTRLDGKPVRAYFYAVIDFDVR